MIPAGKTGLAPDWPHAGTSQLWDLRAVYLHFASHKHACQPLYEWALPID